MKSNWFSNKNCTLLEIKEYVSISDHKVKKMVKIMDYKLIQNLMDSIDKIPPNGEQMKSFSKNVEQIDLLFYCEGKVETIQIIGKKFKTPSTGFNANNELEINLYNEICALLFPNSK